MNSNDRNLPQNETEAATPSTSTGKPAGRSNLWRTIGKVAMWVVLTPIVLLILLSILIYLPPVQRWAVNEASEWLSEETGMEVSVGSVSLKPFLDLEMGDMLLDATRFGVEGTAEIIADTARKLFL